MNRDTQRSRVYAAEWPAGESGPRLSRAELVRFLEESTARLEMRPISLRITRSQGHGRASGISLPRWDLSRNYAMHEITHAYLLQRNADDFHGPVYAGTRLGITHLLAGFSEAYELAKRYVAHGVTVDTSVYQALIRNTKT